MDPEPHKKSDEHKNSDSEVATSNLKIMTKAEQINHLIIQKGFLKIKVNSHISVPSAQKK